MKPTKLLYIYTLISFLLVPLSAITPENQIYLESKLKDFNLAIPRLLSYKHINEIITTGRPSFALPAETESYAQTKHMQLNNSPFFDINFILHPEKVRSYQTKKKVYKADVGTLLSFNAPDGTKINATYYDRGSDTLVVVGGGFTNEREKMAPFTHIFAEYDLLFFDYRGHGIHESSWVKPSTWRTNPLSHLFGVDPRIARLGLEEDQDIVTAVTGMKQRKAYATVVGVGICYSALVFIKAASLHPDLFTHVVADGCWLSLENFAHTLSHDLKRLCSPQRGGWGDFWLTTKHWGRKAIMTLSESIFRLKFTSVSIMDFLPYFPHDVKLLFIHGKDDLVISRQEFETIWVTTPAHHKTAWITSNPHVWNHLKQKELYKLMCDLFITHDHDTFVACLEKTPFLLDQENKLIKQQISPHVT